MLADRCYRKMSTSLPQAYRFQTICDFSLSLAETPIIFSTDGLQPFNHSHFVLHLSEIINHYISLTHCILFRFVRCSDCVNRNVTKSVPWLCSVSQLDLFLVTASDSCAKKKKLNSEKIFSAAYSSTPLAKCLKRFTEI